MSLGRCRGKESDGDDRTGRTHLTSLPNTAFGIALGIGGNAILWRTMADIQFTENVVGKLGNWAFWYLGIGTWLALFGAMIVKCSRHPHFVAREWIHPTRVYFFFSPHLALVMLSIASPASLDKELRALRTVFWIASFVAQVVLSLVVYSRWMFSPIKGDIGHASPPYLLSTVGWQLLCVLAQNINLERRWNYDVPSCLFGVGAVFYSLAFISIMQTMSEHQHSKGAPVLFLIIAPPSVMCVALANFNDGKFGRVPTAVFGFCFFMLLLLLRLGPRLLEKPTTLGAYWAYVFPLAALASACVRFAETYDTSPVRIVAWSLVTLSTFALVIVFSRMSVHIAAVARGDAYWHDPLLAPAPDARDATGPATVPACCNRYLQQVVDGA